MWNTHIHKEYLLWFIWICGVMGGGGDNYLYRDIFLYMNIYILPPLTLNVPGDCGSLRPTRVEPRLHCVDIAWQVQGRCVGSAVHLPLHAIAAHALSAARAIEPMPTHFTLGVPHTHSAARALCSPRTWRPMHWYPFPCIFQPIQIAIQANHGQYYLKSIPFLTQGQSQNHFHNVFTYHKFVKAATIPSGFSTRGIGGSRIYTRPTH